ncbi:MAG TPA: ABC transporter ATP-binding protein [Candidatus Binataceae bacterium]|nr:ABC transporter ATP-binding protein [Candidatus Binataceae bacterium]
MQVAAEEQLGRVYDVKLLKWVWSFVRPYRHLFWMSVVLMPLNTLFALAQPYIFKLAIDSFLAAHRSTPPAWLKSVLALWPGHGLLLMGAVYLVLLLGEVISFYGQFYLTMMVAQYSLSDLRMALFSHVERLPMAFFDRTPAGRLVSRMTTDIDAINEMFSAGSLTLFIDVLTLGGIIVIMFVANARLAAWSLCAVPPLMFIINFFRVRMRAVYREIRERLAALNAYLSEALSGMAVIQLFTRERESRREFDDLNLKSRQVQAVSNIYDGILYSSVETLSAVTVALILWAGGGEVIHRMLTLGTLVAFFDYAQRFFNPLRDVSSKYTTMQSALASAERIEALMETPESIASPPQPRRTEGGAGAIAFEHVTFEYRRGEPVLRDLSFCVEPGEKVAIVGATGSGKTTIIKLLNRFYDVTSGRILVDGIDVREWDLRGLRRAIGLVQQDVFLFAEDILDNVRLGRNDLGEDAVRQALARAQALGFVDRMPTGLHEEIHERGANLSAGQRQLLSFARALAYDPRILVMDEATSSVDSETERLIQRALNELLTDRTALIIAHRLSTIERADRILVLSNGVLRQSGTHEELLKRPGIYRRLFELQYAAATESAANGGRRLSSSR